MTSQEQKGGMGSTNLQVGTVSVGMSYRDVRDIALDVYHENADRLKGEALQIAEARVAELAEELAQKLSTAPSNNLKNFSHPEKQVAILDAQKAYAISGDTELRSMLVDSIIRLSTEPERSTKSIVLSEAIKVLPTLTKPQLGILTICFIMKYCNLNNSDLTVATAIVQSALGSSSFGFPITDGDFRHIEYCRCGAVSILEVNVGQVLAHHKGLGKEAPEDAQSAAKAEFSASPVGAFIVDQWDKTSLRGLTLTSVGLAVAHAFASQNSKAFADLSTWL